MRIEEPSQNRQGPIDRSIDWKHHAKMTRQPRQPNSNNGTYELLYSKEKLTNGANTLENVRWILLKAALDKRLAMQRETFQDIGEVKAVWQWACQGMPWTTEWPDIGAPITTWEKEQAARWTRHAWPQVKAHQNCQKNAEWHRRTTPQCEENRCAKYAHWSETIEQQPQFAERKELIQALEQLPAIMGEPNRFEAWRWTTTLQRLNDLRKEEARTGQMSSQLTKFWSSALHRVTFDGGNGTYRAMTSWEKDRHQEWAQQYTEIHCKGRTMRYHEWSHLSRSPPPDNYSYTPIAETKPARRNKAGQGQSRQPHD